MTKISSKFMIFDEITFKIALTLLFLFYQNDKMFILNIRLQKRWRQRQRRRRWQKRRNKLFCVGQKNVSILWINFTIFEIYYNFLSRLSRFYHFIFNFVFIFSFENNKLIFIIFFHFFFEKQNRHKCMCGDPVVRGQQVEEKFHQEHFRVIIYWFLIKII